jgi:heme/copper-type cytochrome/quinol oxidase subunit 1
LIASSKVPLAEGSSTSPSGCLETAKCWTTRKVSLGKVPNLSFYLLSLGEVLLVLSWWAGARPQQQVYMVPPVSITPTSIVVMVIAEGN